MILKELGFTYLYHVITAVALNDNLKETVKDCPEANKSTHAVIYGFINSDGELVFELLGTGKNARKNFYFKAAYSGPRITLGFDAAADLDAMPFPDLDQKCSKIYEPRISQIDEPQVNDGVKESRTLPFIDLLRELSFPDDIRVLLIKDGLKQEECWVHITGLIGKTFNGILLNQPCQNFGVSENDEIRFNLKQTESKEVLAYCDLNPSSDNEIPSKESMEDGSAAAAAFRKYNSDPSSENLNRFLAILRNSYVYTPYELILTKKAHAIAVKMNAEEKDLSDLSLTDAAILYDGSYYRPGLLQVNDEILQPVYLAEEGEAIAANEPTRFRVCFYYLLKWLIENTQISKIIIINSNITFEIKREWFEGISKYNSVYGDPEEDELIKKIILSDSELPDADDTSEEISMPELSAGNRLCEDIGVSMTAKILDVFNYALHINRIMPVQDVEIQNNTGNEISGLRLRVSSDFHFFKLFEAPLPPIPSGKPIAIENLHLIVNSQMMNELTDTVSACITVDLMLGDKVVSCVRRNVQVLAYDQYQGGFYFDYLPAFVIPNHPVVSGLLHDTAVILKSWGENFALEGYQCYNNDPVNAPNRIRHFAAAAYEAIKRKSIVYANPPASFTVPGQRIRTPELIMSQRLGTCMDMTLLYAAVLEAIDLNPVLVLIEGHIFAGVWLYDKTFDTGIVESKDELTKRFGNGSDELTFVECTCMCDGNSVNFDEAEKTEKIQNLLNCEKFQYAIDVKYMRQMGVVPIPSRVLKNSSFEIETEESQFDSEAPEDIEISVVDVQVEASKKITTKKELWESKLLDLSTHNMLISLPLNRSVLPIMSTHLEEVEDALSTGAEFTVFPCPDFVLQYHRIEKDEKDKEKVILWIQDALEHSGNVFELVDWQAGQDNIGDVLRENYRNHKLYTFITEKELTTDITRIYRESNASQQENGVSSLYLAMGLVRWFGDGSDKPCYAPVVLIPIEIVRKSANQGYAIHARDEEPTLNLALFEMLKQNFNISISGLDPLPKDEKGIDLKKILKIVRSALFSIPRWDVVETCVIGNFSFAQFAMWNDIHSADTVLENSKIVRSLMKGYIDFDTTCQEAKAQALLPITVDGTQLKAIEMAAGGNTFVLHGPPGTGKSQTITAMIANLMAQGKKVLFVAEKMAALSVVEKRLTSLGIGDFCLELHSDKANKKHVLEQLDHALKSTVSVSNRYEEYLEKTGLSRSQLDDYASHLHQIRSCGLSLYDMINRYESMKDQEEYIAFDKDDAAKVTEEMFRSHKSLIGRLTAAGSLIDHLKDHPLNNVNIEAYTAELKENLPRAILSYRDSLKEVMEQTSAICNQIMLVNPETEAEYDNAAEYLHQLLELKNISPVLLSSISEFDKLVKYYNDLNQYENEAESIYEDFDEEFVESDMNVLMNEYQKVNGKKFMRSAAIASFMKRVQLSVYYDIYFEDIPEIGGRICAFQMLRNNKQKSFNELSEEVRGIVKDYSAQQFRTFIENLENAKKKVVSIAIDKDVADKVLNDANVLAKIEEFLPIYANYKKSKQEANHLLNRDGKEADIKLSDELVFCSNLYENLSDLKEWVIYAKARRDCCNAGLKPVVEAYADGMPADILVKAYQKGFFYALIEHTIGNDSVLNMFSGVSFAESIRQFKELDDILMEQTKKEIQASLYLSVPNSWDSPAISSELNLLRKAITSNARGMSLRELFNRIPNVLYKLCPCMLMSPNSVAQYLERKNDLFDIVIFDEASQLPTCRSVGALMRAKDAVIVGDPKQMPPTAFFSGSSPAVDDLLLDDMESILDDALALGIPSQFLQWHYRSTHESLIAFSNHEFYENKMFTFPSANDREKHVSAVHVDGVYKKGTNLKEAEAIVSEIIRRFNDPKLNKQSIGVVTFNMKQQELILDLLNKQYQVKPDLDVWAHSSEDPLFVKNLENVQGDERDVILFSIGFGPDEKGHISMNFGPINRAGGGKRLNVAFSRSRVSMMIFSSIYSSDIKVTESSPEGVKAFRGFLRFAEGVDFESRKPDSENDSQGVMHSICDALKSAGFECQTMLGHSDFKIDIAVINPFDTDKYLMAIMLDGKSYAQTKNTRDREVAQIGVLRRLGWSVYRLWAIDWWDNREKEIKKLLKKLEELKAEAEIEKKKADELAAKEQEAEHERAIEVEKTRQEIADQAEELENETEDETQSASSVQEGTAETTVDAAIVEPNELTAMPSDNMQAAAAVLSEPENKTDFVSNAPVYQPVPYEYADLSGVISLSGSDFAADSAQKAIRECLELIVNAEAPILKDMLIKKVISAFGVNKSASSTAAAEKAFKSSKIKTTKSKGIIVCWNKEQDPKTYRGIRISNDRPFSELCPQEIANAAVYSLQISGPMDKADLIKAVSVVFGYKRLGSNLETSIDNGLQYAKANGLIAILRSGMCTLAE